MSYIPYSRQEIVEADIAAVTEVLSSDFLTQGPTIPRFEREIAALHGAAHGTAVSSATAALHISCIALGVGEGDVVWTSPISFVASANCALYCGASVDFVDIDPATRNMSITALERKLQAARRHGRLPKVVIPVDFSGLPCDLAEIKALADAYGFAIIEDASHAVGATYHGNPVGSGLADITVLSFHPVKIITTGEGGVCLTNNAELADRLARLRTHGITRDARQMEGEPDGAWYYEQIELGFNYRMTDIQAALGSSQLTRLAERHARRDALARRYDQKLAGLPLKLPVRLDDRQSSHHLYVVEIDEMHSKTGRREAFDALRAAGIGINVHYIPIHLQPFYRHLGFGQGDFPASEAYYSRAISLPLFPAMNHEQQDHVIAVIERSLA